MGFDILVVGAGPAGATVARALADAGKRVAVWEKRGHVAGNTYDEKDENGILVHRYGPHIYHTNDARAHAFLSRFTAWLPYTHRVLANVRGAYLPVPFNMTALALVFGDERAAVLREKLEVAYGAGARVSIRTLRENGDPALREVAAYVFDNVFSFYTRKQWGADPSRLDDEAMARVPVVIGTDDRYFADAHQGMPDAGYTALFSSMLAHENIALSLDTDACSRLSLIDGKLYLDGAPCRVPVVYTGALDELITDFDALPYRTLDFVYETLPCDSFQPAAVVNYTVDQSFTRITEFKKLTGQRVPGVTSIAREYPRACERGDIPYYPIPDEDSRARYAALRAVADACPGLTLLGRLAEYRYYNIDGIVSRALDVAAALLTGALV